MEELRDGISPRELLLRNSNNINSQHSIIDIGQLTATHDLSEVNDEDRIFDPPSPITVTNPDNISSTSVNTATPSLSSSSPAPPTINISQGSQAVSRTAAEYQTRHIVSLRRELQHMRVGIERIISSLQDLDDETAGPATVYSSNLNSRLESLEQRLIDLDLGDTNVESEQSGDRLMDLHSLPPLSPPNTESLRTAQNSTYTSQPMLRFGEHHEQQPPNTSRPNPARQQMSSPPRITFGHMASQPTRQTGHSNYDVRFANMMASQSSQNVPYTPNARVQLERQLSDLNTRIQQLQQEVQTSTTQNHMSSEALQRAISDRNNVQRELNHITRTAQTYGGRGRSERQVDVNESLFATMYGTDYARHSNIEEARRLDGQTNQHNPADAQSRAASATGYAPHPAMLRRGPSERFPSHFTQTAASLNQQAVAARNSSAAPSSGAPSTAFPSFSQLSHYRALYGRDGLTSGPSGSANVTSRVGRPEGTIAENSRDLYRLMAEHGGTHAMPGIYYDFNDETEGHKVEEKGLDKDDGRPEPLKDEDMMVKLECKVCFSQLASVAVLPCGKLCSRRLALYRQLMVLQGIV